MDKDVTGQVEYGNIDYECLPITHCICGKQFNEWEFIISVYRGDAYECDNCHRKLYFKNSITVFEVVE